MSRLDKRWKRYPAPDHSAGKRIMAAVNSLTHARLLEVLYYDPEMGWFMWLTRRGRQKAGSVAGTLSHDYIAICIDGVIHLAHRLAWFYVHGVWPEHEIDHWDTIKSNNGITNLRDVPHVVNRQNHAGLNANNTSGVAGVTWDKRIQKWKAHGNNGTGYRWLGDYIEIADAAHAVSLSRMAFEVAIARHQSSSTTSVAT